MRGHASLLEENDLLRVLVRALVRKSGTRVVVSRSEMIKASACVLEILPGRDADGGEQVYVQAWPLHTTKEVTE